MTREEKELLLKDLCARLPYGVICDIYNEKCAITEKLLFGGISHFCDDTITVRPYLRPTSSMTEEEKETYYNLCYEEEREEYEFGEWAARIHYHDTIDSIDYLNSIHIDYRGLIPKGLAIEAPEGMYKTE